MDLDASSDYSPIGGNGFPLTTVTFSDNNVHDNNGSVALRGNHTTRTTQVNVSDNTWNTIGGVSGFTGSQWAALEVNNAAEANVSNNTVDGVQLGVNGEGQAFQFWNVDTLNFHGNTLSNNAQGIYFYSDGVGGSYYGSNGCPVPGGSITFNNITGNGQFGIKVEAAATGGPLDARNNWWGATDGPSGNVTDPSTSATASGSGDAIDAANNNVRFDPWTGAATEEVVSDQLSDGETLDASATVGATATYQGTGNPTVTLANYSSNPGSDNNFAGAGDLYFDIFVEGTVAGDSLEVTLDAGGSTSALLYFDGTNWVPVKDADGNLVYPSGGLYTFTLDDNSTPALSDLSGTPFSGGNSRVRATPATATIAAGETIDVVVEGDSPALFGVDLTLTFDQTKLNVTKVVLGGDLDADTVAVNTYDNGAGTLRFAYTQRSEAGSPKDNVSGDNLELATITFLALSTSSATNTPVEVTSTAADRIFTDKNGAATNPDLDGSVDLTVNPSPKVTADVTLQGRTDYSGVSLEMKPTGSGNVLYDANGSTAAGLLEIDPVPADTYNVRISAPKYLAATKTDTVPADVATYSLTSTSLRLLGGDINQDDQINIQDLAILGSRFGSSDVDDVALADINDDGVINIQDLAIAGGNFGQTTGSAYSW